jgi:hypothetical protein
MDIPNDFEIEINGHKIKANKDQTIAAALMESGIRTFRKTKNNKARGPFCGIGICCECRMIVNDVPNTITCITPAHPGCTVKIQDDTLIERIEK